MAVDDAESITLAAAVADADPAVGAGTGAGAGGGGGGVATGSGRNHSKNVSRGVADAATGTGRGAAAGTGATGFGAGGGAFRRVRGSDTSAAFAIDVGDGGDTKPLAVDAAAATAFGAFGNRSGRASNPKMAGADRMASRNRH